MDGKKEMRHWMGMILLPLMLLFAVSVVTAQMTGQNYQIISSAINSGGGQGSSTNYGVQNSTGQPMPTGISQSPSFGVYAGFQPTTMEEFPQWVPCIRTSSELLDWGTVQIGRLSERILTIDNDGLATLEVSQIAADDPQFSCTPEALSIGPMSSEDVTVVFAPDSQDTIETTLTITCNDPEEPTCCVTLRGVGTEGCAGGELGDANGDGSINVLDVLAVANHILDIVQLDEDGKCRANCNGDDHINILDALNIANVVLGIIPECPGFGSCKTVITPETIDFFRALEPYFAAEEFTRLMALVKTERVIPAEYSLTQNYPNPFNPVTSIAYSLPEAGKVTVRVYNVLGQVVDVLVDSRQEAGNYNVQWDASDLASGVYFYRLTAGDFTATKQMVLMK